MDYKVSALKYRPSEFGKVIGQNHVTDTLKNSVRSLYCRRKFLFLSLERKQESLSLPQNLFSTLLLEMMPGKDLAK